MRYLDLFKREICVGSISQNIGFYIVLAILLCVTYLQFQEANRQKKLKESYTKSFEDNNYEA